MLCSLVLDVANAEDGGPLSFPKWEPSTTEYTRVQTGDWIDEERFVVGRWDGSVAVFRKPSAGEYNPVLMDIRRSQDGSGVEFAMSLSGGFVVSTDGSSTLEVWKPNDSSMTQRYPYDVKFGTANSGIEVETGSYHLLVTGHAEGWIVIWSFANGALKLEKAVDLRSPDPISSPYPLKNIRGLAHWSGSKIVAGSEDGDIAVVDVGTGNVTFRQRYNDSAQRGINSISVVGDHLLVSNCSVGRGDKNLWLFKLESTKLSLLDSINLIDDRSRPQSFNFDADLFQIGETLRFFASTEEGFIWAGTIASDKILPTNTAYVASDGGAFLDVSPSGKTVLAAAHRIYLFDTTLP